MGAEDVLHAVTISSIRKAEAEEFLDVLLGTTRRGAACCAPTRAQTPHFGEDRRDTVFHGRDRPELREQGVLRVGATGQSPLPRELHLPPTVQGVLAARIDRLAPEEKALLATACGHRPRVPYESDPPGHPPARRRTVSTPCLSPDAKNFSTSSPPFPRWNTSSSMP